MLTVAGHPPTGHNCGPIYSPNISGLQIKPCGLANSGHQGIRYCSTASSARYISYLDPCSTRSTPQGGHWEILGHPQIATRTDPAVTA
ncbi:hypothetical protein BDW74DRAFT_144094 [Aspergillus multicolor]|uniref:uncharacterized protein n=1 Tax=Aspergillus multicolor TaxID=41759 RepID=UPI003CCDD4A8